MQARYPENYKTLLRKNFNISFKNGETFRVHGQEGAILLGRKITPKLTYKFNALSKA